MAQPTAQQSAQSTIQQFIRDEITKQLVVMKRQIDLEISRDIKKLRSDLIEEIGQIQKTVSVGLDDVNKQLVSVDSGMNRESTLALCDSMGKSDYNKIMGDLNKTIVPRVNALMQSVSYHSQDTTELITDYRRAVYQQAEQCGTTKKITDGKSKDISQHVSLFFGEDDKLI